MTAASFGAVADRIGAAHAAEALAGAGAARTAPLGPRVAGTAEVAGVLGVGEAGVAAGAAVAAGGHRRGRRAEVGLGHRSRDRAAWPVMASDAASCRGPKGQTAQALPPRMHAIVLAGGFGTRLRPLTYTHPKPLLPLAGRPMLDWVVDRLPDAVEHVTIAANWKADALREHASQLDLGVPVDVVEETEPLGSGGAIRNAAGDGPVLAVNADIISDMDLDALVAQHRDSGAETTIAAAEVPEQDVVHFGVIEPGDGHAVADFVEKPATPAQAPSRLVNAGIYAIEPGVVARIPTDRLVSLEKEIFPQLLPRGLHAWRHDGVWIDVGDRERMIGAHEALGGGVPDDAKVRGQALHSVVGRGAVIEDGAMVERSVIGPGAHITSGSHLIECMVGSDQVVQGQHHGARIWHGDPPAGYPAQQVGNELTAR